MTFLLELKDDFVLISTWDKAGDKAAWYCWGSFHIDALYQGQSIPDWFIELTQNDAVIVDAEFSLNTSMSLPPDNLS